MLALDNIHVNYGAIVALRGVSLNVRENELVALIGANGAGKSTALSTIAGVLKPAGGTIIFQGESIAGLAPEKIIRRGIAMIPETREIFSGLTVMENLLLGGYIRKDTVEFKRDLERMIDLFPILGERLNQAADTLSGGEQQQLAIARALMSHPKLLMLDEPSLGLAPTLVNHVFKLVARLHAEGMTILLVEQNVNQTLKICDRVYLLKMGQVAAQGLPENLREHVDVESVYLGDRIDAQ
ncbi:MAG: ABC transporter ATP-binding protein [Desulfobacterales bacterium]|nr:MAG: ABC transporter ATP-binding protein [Desulfobacterales bacterium]